MNKNLKIFAYHFEPEGSHHQHFIDENGAFILKPIYSYELNNIEVLKITSIIDSFPNELSFGWMCAPIFRDVLIWEDSSKKIENIMQLCFSCDVYINAKGRNEQTFVENFKDNEYLKPILALKELFSRLDKQFNLKRQEDLFS